MYCCAEDTKEGQTKELHFWYKKDTCEREKEENWSFVSPSFYIGKDRYILICTALHPEKGSPV